MAAGSGTSTIIQRFSNDSSGSVVSVDYSSDNGTTFTAYYYLRNGQGDVVKLIDGNGTTVVQYTYYSWGQQLSCTGSLSTSLGANQPFRYRGYVYDTETGWYYLQSRYYNPTTCRFISADVYLSTGQGVLGNNAFAYCGNNPIARTDTEGTFWNIIVGAIVGAIVGGITAAVNGDNVLAGVGIGTAVGAVAGATLGVGLAVAATGTVGATIGGAAIAVAGGAAALAGGEIVRQEVNHEQRDWNKVGKEALVGGVTNMVGFGIGSVLGKAFNSTRLVLGKTGSVNVIKTMAATYKAQTGVEKLISIHLSATIATPLGVTTGICMGE